MAQRDRSRSQRKSAAGSRAPAPVAAKRSPLAKHAAEELALIAGVATTVVFYTFGHAWLADLGHSPWGAAIFAWLFVVMICCAFAVVRHAEALAELLGEPYGTLVLTLSVISIEVTIMAMIMLTGAANPTLPRDTMFAILMIVLNGLVGTTLVIGALRHGQQHYNLQGAIAFLAVIVPLAVLTLVLPAFTQSTGDPTFTREQATVFALLTMLLYGAFLAIQTSRHRGFFIEPEQNSSHARPTKTARRHLPEGKSAFHHVLLLFAALLPVVLLSKPLAKILDYGIEQAGMPTALGGIFIAILVLSPEGLATFKAAMANHLQRAVNLSLGSALSTIGLTVPVVLAISVVTGTPLTLGLDPAGITLLAVTLITCLMTFSGVPTNILFGFIHLVLFFAYLLLVFHP
jgi:Ca2+:H+ antiporter